MHSLEVAAPRATGRRALALSAVLYLATSLWTLSDALFATQPSLLVSFPGTRMGIVQLADQRMVLTDVARNASRLLSAPWSVGDFGQCFPIEKPFRLGEHAFGAAFLTAPFLAVGLDPARALASTLVLQRFLGALGMFLLARRLTGSSPAAFVAGFVFGFGHNRLADPVHPFVWGDHWMPWAMLFLHRLFSRERWRDAAGLAASVSLMLGESVYVLISAAIVGTIWLAYLAWAARRRLVALLPKLVAAAIPPLALAWPILGPYLGADELVRFQSGMRLYVLPGDYAPGRVFFPGFVPLGLAAVGLLARASLDGERPFGDPRPWIALAGLAVWICAIEGFPFPGVATLVPSPLVLARDWIPILAAVRAIPSISSGLYLCLALLAAFGVVAIARRLPAAGGAAVAAVLALVWLGELYSPVLGRGSFGSELRLEPVAFALDDGDRAWVDRVAGPVVELAKAPIRTVGDSSVLAAHHRAPVGSCHQSHPSPYVASIEQLARGLPSAAAATALAHLGFTDVIVHAHGARGVPRGEIDRLREAPTLQLVADSGTHALFRLRPREGEAIAAWRSLRLGVRSAASITNASGILLDLEIANPTEGVFVHTTPLRLVPATLRWKDPAGNLVETVHEGVHLPAGLLPGKSTRRLLLVPTPPPGDYTAELEIDGRSSPVFFGSGIGLRVDPPPPARPGAESAFPPPVRAVRLETDPLKQAEEPSTEAAP